jgi:glycosyltransferase involved in cell wall biosynthesis/CTP:molybdopterin cytidylyltransferase MocA
MMKTPLVTIYITNYNYGNFIQRSIESALCQTFQDFELLIIDDGSVDNSKEIIEQYRNNPKISIIYQHNKGLNITNNIAMRAANGKYLMRLDADDFLEPDAIEVMSNILEDDDDLGLVFPDYYYVDAEGHITGEERRHDFDKEVSLYDQPAHGACTMIRLSFLKELGGYNESFTCQDGYDLWIKFITHHKVTNVNRPLFSYRRHGNNLTTNENKILSTRKKIKELFVEQYFVTPYSIAVIPVRNTYIGDVNWPLYEVNGKTILEHKIDTCVEAKKLQQVIVSTSDQEILDFCRRKLKRNSRLVILERPKEFSRANESLAKTLLQAVEHVEASGGRVEAIMSITLEYPFLSTDVIDDAINTLTLFKSDAVLSVRPDNRMYYQHTGHTLKPILDQDKFTKLEREALYRGAGGVVLSTRDNFINNNKLVTGRISHIVVDQKTAFDVVDHFSFEMFKHYNAAINAEESQFISLRN